MLSVRVFQEPTLPAGLPTGNDLMSGPISSGVVTRAQKETQFVLTNITHRLNVLVTQQDHDRFAIYYLILALLSGSVGTVLVLYGMRKSILFDFYDGHDYVAFGFGVFFFVPCFLWLVFLFCPTKSERELRRKLQNEDRDRKKPTLFNEMVNRAKKFSEPPTRKIRVDVIFRKKTYHVTASTMRDFCESVESQTGLPIERQLVRHFDEDLEVILEHKLDEHYHLDNGATLYVYNKGGFATADSPVKRQYEALTERMQQEIREKMAQVDEDGNFKLRDPAEQAQLDAEAAAKKKKKKGSKGNFANWVEATPLSFNGGSGGGGETRRSFTNTSTMKAQTPDGTKGRVSWKV